MLTQYLIAFFWGIIVLLSFLGYGRIINLWLSPKTKFDYGMHAAFGMIFSVVLGGFLNVTHLISDLLIKIFVIVGVFLFLFFVFTDFKELILFFHKKWLFIKSHKIFSFAVVALFLMVIMRYGFAVSFFGFNGSDDHHGYLAFPAQMLQTGSLTNDPFNERRLESSLGGQYFLHSIILSATSFKNLHLTDNGLGYLILLLLLVGFLIEKKVHRNIILVVVSLMLLIDSPVLNITAAYTAAAVFFLFYRLSYNEDDKFKDVSIWQRSFLIALPIAVLCTLKSTFVVVAALLFLGHYYLTYRRISNFKYVLKEFLIAGLIVMIILLPWMLSMLASSGTLFYPIFGRGYQGTVYGAFTHVIRIDLYSLLRLLFEGFTSLVSLLPLAFIGLLAYALRPGHEKRFFWLVFLTNSFGVLTLIILLAGYSLFYYSFPYLLPTILFITILLLSNDFYFYRFPNFNSRWIGLLLIFFLGGAFLQRDFWIMQRIKDSINIDGGVPKFGLMNSNLISESELKQYADLQNAVPSGEIIVSRLDRNFVFDFKRNRIFITDSPGGASLPPGLPLKNGSEAMAEYFLSHNIKYIAYSYSNEANFSRGSVSGMLKAHVNPLLRSISENGLAFQDYIMELSQTRKIIYDDGKNLVLDLSIRK